MILYNQELGDEDCDFNLDKNTKQFLVSFFGFYRHDIRDDFNSFLKEIGIKNIIEDVEESTNDFKLNGNNALEAYNMYDRRTFDITLILPKVFSNKQDAIDWFTQKVKESEYIKKSEITEIDVLDADKLFDFLYKELNYAKKVKNIYTEFDKRIIELKQNMLNDFSNDPDFKRIIEERFERLK